MNPQIKRIKTLLGLIQVRPRFFGLGQICEIPKTGQAFIFYPNNLQKEPGLGMPAYVSSSVYLVNELSQDKHGNRKYLIKTTDSNYILTFSE